MHLLFLNPVLYLTLVRQHSSTVQISHGKEHFVVIFLHAAKQLSKWPLISRILPHAVDQCSDWPASWLTYSNIVLYSVCLRRPVVKLL